jgi:hypothetical protein
VRYGWLRAPRGWTCNGLGMLLCFLVISGYSGPEFGLVDG